MYTQGGSKFDAAAAKKAKQQQSNKKVYYMYTGLADVEILKINPTRDEIIELTEVPEQRQDKIREPEYVSDKGTRLSVLCKLEPRKLMWEKAVNDKIAAAAVKNETVADEDLPKIEDFSQYQEKYFFDFTIFIGRDEVLTKTGKKAFSTRDMKTTYAESLETLMANKKPAFMFEDRVFLNEAGETESEPAVFRTLLNGEMTVLSLLHAASNLINTKNNEGVFMFGATEEENKEAFKDIVGGDWYKLNDFLEGDLCKDEEGNKLKVSMFLTVREGSKMDNNNVPYYNQDVFIPYGGKGFNKMGLGATRDVQRAIDDNRCKNEYQGTMEFLPFDRVAHNAKFAASMVANNSAEFPNVENTPDFPTMENVEGDDDLPF